MQDLIEYTNKGFYCLVGNFYIDPIKPVDKALITHAHSDHARWGHGSYLSNKLSVPIIKERLGNSINIQGVEYGEIININDVKVSFHPAGHVVGSAQIRLEYNGEVWVITGDYKIENDNVSTPFELVKCDTFVTECTFGRPYFNWQPQEEIFNNINEWWVNNQKENRPSVLMAYTLGKTQRVLKNIDPSLGKIVLDSSANAITDIIKAQGIELPKTYSYKELSSNELNKALVIGPSSIRKSKWVENLQNYSSAYSSGWMQLPYSEKRFKVEKGFTISDHVDWNALNKVVKDTGASRVFTIHGFTKQFTQWLNDQGIESYEVGHKSSIVNNSQDLQLKLF
jgi:putative mRNA 3-end processing factor